MPSVGSENAGVKRESASRAVTGKSAAATAQQDKLVFVSALQVRWHRLRRSGLTDEDAYPSAIDCCRELCGLQAQDPQAAAMSLWNRVRLPSTAAGDEDGDDDE